MSERVYVISAGPTAQKVGIADDPVGRLAGMQTGCPLKLSLILSLETPHAREVEQSVHRLFSGYRIRGEWFEVGPVTAVQAVCAALVQRELPASLRSVEVQQSARGLTLVESELIEDDEAV